MESDVFFCVWIHLLTDSTIIPHSELTSIVQMNTVTLQSKYYFKSIIGIIFHCEYYLLCLLQCMHWIWPLAASGNASFIACILVMLGFQQVNWFDWSVKDIVGGLEWYKVNSCVSVTESPTALSWTWWNQAWAWDCSRRNSSRTVMMLQASGSSLCSALAFCSSTSPFPQPRRNWQQRNKA